MGFSISTQPTYLYQTPSGYFFRLRVPNDLKGLVGKTEFRYSLRAGGLQLAKYRARCIASFVQQLFFEAREDMTKYTQEYITDQVKGYIREIIGDKEACKAQKAQAAPGAIIDNGELVSKIANLKDSNGKVLIPAEGIPVLVQQYVRETLNNDEKCRAIEGTLSTRTITLEGKTMLEGSNMKAAEARSLLKSVSRWLQVPDHSLMHPITEKILRAQGIEVDQESETYKLLSRDLLIAFQGVLKVRIKRSEGDYSIPDEDLIPLLKWQTERKFELPEPVSKVEEPEAALRFTEVQDKYLCETEAGERWTEKTRAENISIFALFVRVCGDMPIDQINKRVMSDFKDVLVKLPSNLNIRKEYRDKSIDEILASKPAKTLTTNTVNKYLRRLGGLFNFAVDHGVMSSNPAANLQIRSKRRKDQERQAYEREDLVKLFNSKEYIEGKHKQSYAFWTPLIALFTGCRLEEICQMHLDDIYEEDGVWVFDINDKAEKRLKTLSSTRIIPIHPELIELGILEHAESLRSKNEKRLFPELRQRRDGYSQTVSKWFARYRVRCGIVEEGKTFHSFRHTFITHLKHKQVDPYMIHELDGHTVDSEFGRYGKRYTPEILLKEAIQKIDFGLELSIIKC